MKAKIFDPGLNLNVLHCNYFVEEGYQRQDNHEKSRRSDALNFYPFVFSHNFLSGQRQSKLLFFENLNADYNGSSAGALILGYNSKIHLDDQVYLLSSILRVQNATLLLLLPQIP